MAYILNEKLKNLVLYSGSAGVYDVRLDANESFLNPGELFKEELQAALLEMPLNRYPDPSCRKLREAFGKAYRIAPERVVAGNGSDELLSLLLGAFLQDDQKLLTLEPDFSMYGVYAEIYGKQMVSMEKENMEIHVDSVLEKMEREQADVLIFSNPCNPVSSVLKRDDVVRLIRSTDKLVIVDEAYMDFDSEDSVVDLAGVCDNLIVLKTCSKAWGCAGIRLGFAVSSEEITGVLNALRSPYNVSSFTQAAGCVILNHAEYLQKAAEEMKASAAKLYAGLLPLEKCGKVKRIRRSKTNFVFIETERADELHSALRERSILIRKTAGNLRITAGTEEENRRVIEALFELFGEEREQK